MRLTRCGVVRRFRWTALLSFCSVLMGVSAAEGWCRILALTSCLCPQTVVYSAYLRKTRGHLLHWSYKGHGKDGGPNDPRPRVRDSETARLLEEDDGR